MPHEALEEYLPGPDGKPELYKAAGKLKGKKGMCNYSLTVVENSYTDYFFSTHHWWRVRITQMLFISPRLTLSSSGIGRATAVLFAMEGVSEIMITYLPEEKKDAESAKTKIEKFGAKCHTYPVDLTEDGSSKKLADEAVKTMGNVNILFNNHAYQEVIQDPIKDLSEEVSSSQPPRFTVTGHMSKKFSGRVP